jgi:hypothetical protein
MKTKLLLLEENKNGKKSEVHAAGLDTRFGRTSSRFTERGVEVDTC